MDGQSWPILPRALGKESNFSSQSLKLLVQEKIIKHLAVPNLRIIVGESAKTHDVRSWGDYITFPQISLPRAPGMPATHGCYPRKPVSFLLPNTSVLPSPRDGLERMKPPS